MGDSETSADLTTTEVVREEGATIQSVSQHTVSSVETSHMESTQESVVHIESVVQESSSSSTSVSQAHSILVTSSGEETLAVEEALASQPAIEPQPVDENANSIPDEPAAVTEPVPPSEPEPAVEPIPEPASEPVPEPASEPVPEPASEPAPEPASEPVPEPLVESAPEPEPVSAPEPTPVPEAEPVTESVPEPAPVEEVIQDIPATEEISQENIKTQLHEIISEIDQEILPEQDEVKEISEMENVSAVTQEEEKEVAKPVEDSQQVVEPQPVDVPQPVAESQPVVEPQPLGEPQLVDGQIPPGFEGEMEEYSYYDEDGTLRHTWRPRGKYNVQKTEIVYEDIVPIQVPDVTLPELPVQPPPSLAAPLAVNQEQLGTPMIPNNIDALPNGGFDGGDLTPSIDIPEGIPLLARILPKTDQGLESDKKITLERLFTPATDSGDLTPMKKKAFASSAFYRPDHPTIDDQVELAQRISFSLVDDNNKMSRGQSMYMKRKKRSMRWIHQGEEGEYEYEAPGMEMMEDDLGRAPEKPPMKLLMSSKGVQDFQQVQEHYQNLMNQPAPPSPEVNKLVTEISSPSGKGAELFAKRKKRMDKFIVDETTVQKSQMTSMTQQSSSFSSMSSSSQNIESGFSVGGPVADPGAGAIYTAEVKVVQRAAPNPIDVPHHSLHDLVTTESKIEKRRSNCFNLAAKGFGTYNNFYKAVQVNTQS